MSQIDGPDRGLRSLRSMEQALWRVPSWVVTERTLDVLRGDFVFEAITDEIGDLLCSVSPPSRGRVIDKLANVRDPDAVRRFVEFVRSGKVRTRPFPASPIVATASLTPLDSPLALRRESVAMGVAFDSFWIESVFEGAAYFYAWHEAPAATALVVFSDQVIDRIEVRGEGDKMLDSESSSPIVDYILRLFGQAGFRDGCSERSH